ncbi:IclR family transcriptional regulator domain-containing protein [Streptomyces sp. URMC 128]|uniref:IclR family transcriptional regulator domain-containing protein n=1 Tax=Streptomyces sp. URMC 128 TaxID=3423404 RepID=UPI003F1B3421
MTGSGEHREEAVTDTAELHAELRRVKVRGYAVDQNRYGRGLPVAAPVLDRDGAPLAAVAVSAPDSRTVEKGNGSADRRPSPRLRSGPGRTGVRHVRPPVAIGCRRCTVAHCPAPGLPHRPRRRSRDEAVRGRLLPLVLRGSRPHRRRPRPAAR